MTDYEIERKSRYSSEVSERIVIEEKENTRKVLHVVLNDRLTGSGETVNITIIHQRKKNKDEWDDVESINLNTLRGGDGVKLKLDSRTTKRLYDKLSELYKLVEEKGIGVGKQKFTVVEADEIIKIPEDRKTFIKKLLEEDFGLEVWIELTASNPDLATRLSFARIQTNRIQSLEVFKNALDDKTKKEDFWQDFFSKNDWIFGYGLNYQFLHLLEDQPSYGGTDYSGRGNQRGDFLMSTLADSSFTVLVEIKTPQTYLLSHSKNDSSKIVNPRNGVWLMNGELISAIQQLQTNCRTWHLHSQDKNNAVKLENEKRFTVEPKGIVVIGSTEEFNGYESVSSSFECFRRNIHNPEIITFDELYKRAEFIVTSKTQQDTQQGKADDELDDLPF